MQRLAGFGMAVLLALSLVGLGFDVAMARLGGETISSASSDVPAAIAERGQRFEHAAARPETAASMNQPIAPVVSASRTLRVPRPRPVM